MPSSERRRLRDSGHVAVIVLGSERTGPEDKRFEQAGAGAGSEMSIECGVALLSSDNRGRGAIRTYIYDSAHISIVYEDLWQRL